jgi:hypothetical protein
MACYPRPNDTKRMGLADSKTEDPLDSFSPTLQPRLKRVKMIHPAAEIIKTTKKALKWSTLQ